LKKDGLGFQIFNATNDEITNLKDTAEFLAEACPNVPFTRTMGQREAPMSNEKLKSLLNFKEQHNWRQYGDSGTSQW
jgi:nucleoside-diphosphate-sugar epimerase